MHSILKPTTFEDLVFASANTESTLNDIRSGVLPFPSSKHGIILYGSLGTGKTTAAPIICDMVERAISGHALQIAPDVIDCTGTERIDQIINNLENQTQFLSLNLSSHHYFIFDEVDNLTDPAQRKLRMFIQRPYIVSVMTTNYIDQLDGGLRDRCHVLDFNPLTEAQMIERVRAVVEKHKLEMPSDDQMKQLVASSNGSWRNVVPKLRKFFGV